MEKAFNIKTAYSLTIPSKKLLPIVIILGLLILVGVAGYFLIKGGVSQSTTGGYTSLSISDVQVVDDGQRIRIYGVANGAETISINFNPSKINEYIKGDGYEVTKPVIGTIKLVDPTRTFNALKDSSKNFYELKYLDLGILKNCDNNAPYGTVSLGRIATSTCLYYNSKGTYSIFTGQYTDSTPVNINIGGSTGTLNPSSGNNVLTLNDGKTKVEWVGNLLNYRGLNTPNYALLYSSSQYSKLIDVGSYNSQQTALNTLTDCLGSSRTTLARMSILGIIFKSNSNARGCVSNFNNKVNGYLIDKTNTYKNSVEINNLEFTNNGIKLDLTTPTVFPTFIITLDASSVGIIELKGEPNIVSCVADKTIDSGDTYNGNVKVKNTGNNDGSFYGQVSCSGSSSVSGMISEQFVSAGSTVTFPVQISGTNKDSGTDDNNCKVKIIDRKSQDSDECSFEISVEYQEDIICSPNSITCLDSNTLKICSSDGTSYNVKDCEVGCTILESGEAICKTSNCLSDSDCKKNEICEEGFCIDDKKDLECDKWYQEKKCGALCEIGITKGSCKTATWVWLAGILFILASIMVMVIISSRGKK